MEINNLRILFAIIFLYFIVGLEAEPWRKSENVKPISFSQKSTSSESNAQEIEVTTTEEISRATELFSIELFNVSQIEVITLWTLF